MAGLRTHALLVLLAVGCAMPPAAAQQRVAPPVGGLIASLDDRVREVGGRRIAWSTYWRLCWNPYPEATAYQMQVMTSEGISPKLRDLSAPCFRIEVAANENPKEQGLRFRDEQLATSTAQLAVRIRAVLADGRVSAWSVPAAVGERLSSPR